MTSRPTPDDAAKALRNVDQRTGQAMGSLYGGPRWLDVFFGVVIFLYCASTDFLPDAGWPPLVFAALIVGYAVLIRTRRGAALVGQPTRRDRRAVPPRLALVSVVAITVIMAGSLATVLVLGATGASAHVPYLSTILGAVMAIVLIAFGPRLRRGMAALSARSARAGR